MDRRGRVGLELRAQPADVDVDRPRVAVMAEAPRRDRGAGGGCRRARGGRPACASSWYSLGRRWTSIAVAADLVGDRVQHDAVGDDHRAARSRPAAGVEDSSQAAWSSVDGDRVAAGPRRTRSAGHPAVRRRRARAARRGRCRRLDRRRRSRPRAAGLAARGGGRGWPGGGARCTARRRTRRSAHDPQRAGSDAVIRSATGAVGQGDPGRGREVDHGSRVADRANRASAVR